MIKKRNPKNNISKTKKTKEAKSYETNFRFDYVTMRQKPFSIATLENLAKKMIDWANDNPNSLSLNEFLILQGLDADTLDDFCKRCEKLKLAKKHTIMILGTRREIKGLYREIEPSLMKFMQGHYDPTWAKREKELAALRNVDNQTRDINVYLDGVEQLEKKSKELHGPKPKRKNKTK